MRRVLLVIVLVCCAGRGYADNLAPKINNCANARCHKDIRQLTQKHRAFKWGCGACHHPIASKRHSFRLLASGQKLCRLCHRSPKKKHVHTAVTFGRCNFCHDPHGSDHRQNLRMWPVNKLCRTCHPRKKKQANQHPPYREGKCDKCHDPHQSDHKALLKASADQICVKCHKTDKLLKDPFRHAPVKQGRCNSCHFPHQSKLPKLVRDKDPALCQRCHQDKPNRKLRFVHKAMKRPCSTCHKPHAAKHAKLLVAPTATLCYRCHKRQDKAQVVHSAVKLGRCGGCHEPHASAFKNLLHTSQIGDLCFRCHCDDVTRRASVHWPVKGRVCQRCHDAHGAKERSLLVRSPTKICTKCHGDHRAMAGSGKVHGALRQAGCQACHDPHGSAATRLLKKPEQRLCTACHPRQRDGAHVFTSPSGRPHPVSGKADPLHPGRTLSCVSCHAMSSSTSPKLLRGGKSKMQFCATCHEGGYGRLKPRPKGQARRKPSHNYPAVKQKKVTP